MPTHLLPLENLLKKKSKSKNSFPDKNGDYFNRYCLIKEWLTENVYKHIGSAAGAKDGQHYNDHGVDHFNAVIRQAGCLVGLTDSKGKMSILQPYEVYLLLCSILIHDAGMVYGRQNHEKKAQKLLSDMGGLAIGDSFERRQIADIAEAHGGKTSEGNKDTIGNKNLKDEDMLIDCVFRPKLIAGVVRFADEISEDKMRAARFLSKANRIKKSNQVFHRYSQSVNSTHVDLKDKTIKVCYRISISDLTKLFGRLDKEVYLIDEIISRLEKMHLELRYCSRYFKHSIHIDRIRANIDIVDNKDVIKDNISISIAESGYPTPDFNLTSLYPDINGLNYASKYS